MKTTTVVPVAAAAAFVPRPAAPIAETFGGTGVPAGHGARWRFGTTRGSTAPDEPDSASGALTV